MRTVLIIAVLAASLLFGCIGAKEAPAAPIPAVAANSSNAVEPAAPIPDAVQTDAGLVRGSAIEGINTYLGIPYATPPVGALRWKPPQQVAPWNGVLNATEFAFPCTQDLKAVEIVHEAKNATSEDCLYLNVWAPKNASGLPVMVWIHGGAFAAGSGSIWEYRGRELAKKGVVAVNLNYRLGPFGFLVHPELAAESPNNASGNYGLLDQRAAFQWVNRNIAAFGGDPEQVTIFGESAGSISVSSHIISPLSKGLFKRAICESGTIFSDQHALPDWNFTLSGAEKIGQDYAAGLGCGKTSEVADCMRGKTAEELQNATLGKMEFSPVDDGWFFPEDPELTLIGRKQNNVSLMIGFNADEGTLFTNTTADAAKEYREAAFVRPERMVADSMESRVYFYEFTRVPPTKYGKLFGAYHSSEIQYVLGTLDAADGYGADDFALSEKMMEYWVNFAKNGDPNSAGLPVWPVYDKQAREYLVLGNSITVKNRLS